MKKLSIGIQTFSELIEDNYIYVDKTRIIYEMITSGKYYFLSRPRRFGKSLLVSTLADIFSGKKELFNNLAINSLPYDWKKHPVIMISFAGISSKTPELLENGIKLCLQRIAHEYNIALPENFSSGQMLQELVMQLSTINRVVLLIDEYDYSILKHIHDEQSAYEIREILKDFYSVIKDLDKYFKFCFLTGVSKFSQTSIFSGLNNLNDISLDRKFNTLLGYTYNEIITYFQSYIEEAAHYNKCSIEQLLSQITKWYDGYLFTTDQNATKIYNPYSVLLFFSKQNFSNYWFSTGTPTFLINLIKNVNYSIQDFEQVQATSSELGAFEIENISLKTLLFQTGYLTLSSKSTVNGNYVLTYPNKETVDSLFEYIFASMTQKDGTYLNTTVANMLEALKEINFIKLYDTLTHFFAGIPYTITINQEKYYQSLFYVLFKIAGADIIVESPTNIGRIDTVIKTEKSCFIIEMKINSTADAALQQIKKKKYYQAYTSDHKNIMLVGISFDTKTKNISELKHEKLDAQTN